MCSEGGARGSWTSQEAFQRINSLLDQLAGENLNSAPAESMGDDQVALQRIVNRVQAEGLRRLRRFDSGQGYAPSGALSARAWLRWQLNLTATTASERVAISRKLAALANTEQALAEGDISYRHAVLIAETASQLGEKFEAQAETILVDAAKELDPWRLQRAILHLKHLPRPRWSSQRRQQGEQPSLPSPEPDVRWCLSDRRVARCCRRSGPQHRIGFGHGTQA